MCAVARASRTCECGLGTSGPATSDVGGDHGVAIASRVRSARKPPAVGQSASVGWKAANGIRGQGRSKIPRGSILTSPRVSRTLAPVPARPWRSAAQPSAGLDWRVTWRAPTLSLSLPEHIPPRRQPRQNANSVRTGHRSTPGRRSDGGDRRDHCWRAVVGSRAFSALGGGADFAGESPRDRDDGCAVPARRDNPLPARSALCGRAGAGR